MVDHMFEGGGYGVGVTVASLEPMPWPATVLAPGVVERPTGWAR